MGGTTETDYRPCNLIVTRLFCLVGIMFSRSRDVIQSFSLFSLDSAHKAIDTTEATHHRKNIVENPLVEIDGPNQEKCKKQKLYKIKPSIQCSSHTPKLQKSPVRIAGHS